MRQIRLITCETTGVAESGSNSARHGAHAFCLSPCSQEHDLSQNPGWRTAYILFAINIKYLLEIAQKLKGKMALDDWRLSN